MNLHSAMVFEGTKIFEGSIYENLLCALRKCFFPYIPVIFRENDIPWDCRAGFIFGKDAISC